MADSKRLDDVWELSGSETERIVDELKKDSPKCEMKESQNR